MLGFLSSPVEFCKQDFPSAALGFHLAPMGFCMQDFALASLGVHMLDFSSASPSAHMLDFGPAPMEFHMLDFFVQLREKRNGSKNRDNLTYEKRRMHLCFFGNKELWILLFGNLTVDNEGSHSNDQDC